jgi:hypothetical protein
VGLEDEVAVTFEYEGDRPPWVSADSWGEAAATCKTLRRSKVNKEVFSPAMVNFYACSHRAMHVE